MDPKLMFGGDSVSKRWA